MIRKIILGLVIGLCSTVAFGMSVEEIIAKIDYNQAPDNVIYDGKMVISRNGKETVKEMKMYGTGKTKTFIEFLSPPRDKGMKNLRLDDNVWIYMPSAEKTVKISGHQLREGMAGSDFSYEDQMERVKFLEKYNGLVEKEEEYNGRKMYVLSLTLKPNTEGTYYKRVIWVDKEQYVAYKSEMYAKSGKLLKELTVNDVKKIGERYYAVKIRMEDKLKGKSYTEIELSNIILDKKIPEDIFSLKNLEKKN